MREVEPSSEVTVALEGTLDTVSLPEVLRLLAAGKTGRLGLRGPRGEGGIDVRGGRVVAAETARTGRVETASELPEVVFELLRSETGAFAFVPAEAPRDGEEQAAPVPMEELLEDASARLARWREVEQLVPSLASSVAVVDEAPEGEVTVVAATWPVLVAAARSATVGDVGARLGLDEVAASYAVRDLVTAGLARVGPAVAQPEQSAPAAEPRDVPPPATGSDGGSGDSGVDLLERLTGGRWTWVDDGAGGRRLHREGSHHGPVPDWAVDGAVGTAPVAAAATAPVDDPPAPVVEPSTSAPPAAAGLGGAPDWAGDDALDEAFAGWVPGPSAEAHPLERELAGLAAPEAEAAESRLDEHGVIDRLLGTLRA